MRTWTYQQLTAESDVVAIVQPLENKPNSEKLDWPPSAHGVDTTFKVLSCLKGQLPTETLVLRHFIYHHDMPPDGGRLIDFLPGPLAIRGTIELNNGKEDWTFNGLIPEWLAFLKRNHDGTFSPTAGQLDPDISFKELHGLSLFQAF